MAADRMTGEGGAEKGARSTHPAMLLVYREYAIDAMA